MMAQPMPQISAETMRRFFSYVEKGTSCWIWKGDYKPNGYGRFRIGKVRYAAHRISFFIHFSHISQLMEIDHTCRVRDCVNPAHLEEVTKQENQKRKRQ